MIDTPYIQNLQVGDLVGVSYASSIIPGIFAGVGSKNNPQYYSIYDFRHFKPTDIIKHHKSYIGGTIGNCYRLVRIDLNSLDPTIRDFYFACVKYLQEVGKIPKNYDPYGNYNTTY